MSQIIRPDTNKYRQGSQDFRNQRAEDFKNQKISKASNFNFDQYNPGSKGNPNGGTHVSGAEVRHLRQTKTEGGLQGKIDALQAQKDAGANFGSRAEASFQNMKSRQDAKRS